MAAHSDAAPPPHALGRSESAGDWVQRHGKTVIIAAVLLGALVAGWYVYRSTQERSRVRAEAAYFEAQQTMASGNAPAGRTALQSVATRYGNTPAGVQATIFLAQLEFDEKKYAEGIRRLQDAAGKGAAETYRSSIYGLIGAAYEEQGKWAEAATNYRRAADEAAMELDRLGMQANEARVHTRAGKVDEARRIWAQLAEDPSGPLAGEARVRLGELQSAGTAAAGRTAKP